MYHITCTDIFFFISSLGTEVVVELKQDIQIRGVVDEVDVAMNLALHSATQTNRDGSTVEFESIVVQGPSIRLVQIPSKIRMRAQVSEYLKKIDRIKVQSRPHAIKDRPKLVAPEPSDRSDIVLN
jgi:small nuclear ribonucleoprotein (snRNP)-like protein